MHRLLFVCAILLLLAGCNIHAPVPSEAEMAETAAVLETVLPAFAETNVQDLPSSAAGRCNLPDAASRRPVDWEYVDEVLRRTSVSAVTNITCDHGGRVVTATFHVRAGDFDRFSYIYDPQGQLEKGPNPDTIVIEQINDAWWFVSEDWN